LDMILNVRQSFLEKNKPYTVLLLWEKTGTKEHILQSLWVYAMYDVTQASWNMTANERAAYDIILVAGQVEKQFLQSIADEARIRGQSCYHVGDTLFLEDLISSPQRLGPLIALEYRSSPLSGWRRVAKRIIDVCTSCLGLIMLLPIFLLIAVCIKLDSDWPILCIQKRIGKNKKEFRFIKFRSMFTHLSVWERYGGKEADKLYKDLIASKHNVRKWVLAKIKNDPRITRVGNFLRKTSLDELPSLWSVFVGDMSLVGPRPHMPNEVNAYDQWQERLFSIKPWITGYAQIFGRDALPFEEEARLDLYYIQHRSLLLDMYVLVSTCRVVFSGK